MLLPGYAIHVANFLDMRQGTRQPSLLITHPQGRVGKTCSK